jgi:hypothetical protein
MSYESLLAIVPADEQISAFVFTFGCSFSISSRSGETFIEYQPIAKPSRCA